MKVKIASTSPYGLYQYCRMPSGLAGTSGWDLSINDRVLKA